MILRVALGRSSRDTHAPALAGRRDQLTRAARGVIGLESVILGVRHADGGEVGSEATSVDAAVVSAWRDVESMRRATGDETEDRVVARRLEIPFRLETARHYEVIDRAFGGLPPEATAILRIVTVRARVNEEAQVIEILRARQPRMIERGQVGSQVARRLLEGGEVEAVVVGLWPDRPTFDAATAGGTGIVDPQDLEAWADRLSIDTFDAVEIAPRLSMTSGPPIFILDSDLRIVDITGSASAILGMPAEELVGSLVEELSFRSSAEQAETWAGLLRDGTVDGETAWRIPDVGSVRLRFVARRDVPIPGRHAVYVRRRLDPAPTLADLDAAIADAYGWVPPDAEARATE